MTSRTTLLKRTVATVTAAAAALTGTVVLVSAPAHASLKKAETPFSYRASAYGTRVTLGDPGQGGLTSGRTAWSILACTKMAPVRNAEGSFGGRVNANSMVKVGAIDSVTSSYRKPRKKHYGSRSVNRVADIVLGAEGGPQLRIDAARTVAHAFNRRGRFGATSDFDLVGVEAVGITPEGSETPGPLGDLLDAIGQADDELVGAVVDGAGTNGIDIPGLGTVHPAGTAKTASNRRMARSNAFGIRVELENGSTVTIGRAWATIEDANPAGVFAGIAYGLEADVVEGTLGIGRTPFQIMRCVGTDGKWISNSLAELPQHESLTASALRAETFGRGFADGRAVARSRATVGRVSLGGQLVIEGVVGKVNVFQNRAGRVVRRNTIGTRVGAITANGETYEAPAPGESLEIPGVAVIKARVRTNLGRRGVQVHALRVEMLDGSGSVINVGTARAGIRR